MNPTEQVMEIDVWQVVLSIISALLIVLILALMIWYIFVEIPRKNKEDRDSMSQVSNRIYLLQHRIENKNHTLDLQDAFWTMAVLALEDAYEGKPKKEWPFPEGELNNFHDLQYQWSGGYRTPNEYPSGDLVAEATTMDWAAIFVSNSSSKNQLLVYYNSNLKSWVWIQIDISGSAPVVTNMQTYEFDIMSPVNDIRPEEKNESDSDGTSNQ